MKMGLNSLDSIDHLILASITNDITKYVDIFKKCEKKLRKQITKNTNVGKFRNHVNKLEEMNLITIDKKDSWITRNTNPAIILKKDGQKYVKENIEKINHQWELANTENNKI